MLKIMFTFCLLGLSLPVHATPKPVPVKDSTIAKEAKIPAELKAQILKQAQRDICPPEGESDMYCKAHSVYVLDDYVMVLASVQPTAGIFVLYKSSGPKTLRWTLLKDEGDATTFSLLAYREVLKEAALPEKVKTYFVHSLTARKKRRR